MDLSQLVSVLRLSWDLPWRLAGSFTGLATIAGVWIGGTPLRALVALCRWVNAPSSWATALLDAHHWLISHSAIGLVGLALEIVGLTFSGRTARSVHGTRAAATALLGTSLAVECGWAVGAVVGVGVSLLLWLASLVYRVATAARQDFALFDEAMQIEEWLRRTWLRPLVAVFYFPLAPIAWVTRA